MGLIAEVRAIHPGDQATLQACTMYFRETGDCEYSRGMHIRTYMYGIHGIFTRRKILRIRYIAISTVCNKLLSILKVFSVVHIWALDIFVYFEGVYVVFTENYVLLC